MSSEVAVNHHQQQQELQQNHSQQTHQLEQHQTNSNPSSHTLAPASSPRSNTMATTSSSNHPVNHQVPGISSAITAATAAQAAAAAAAAGRDMKNFSDLEINELLGLIPDEYTAEQQAEEAAAAATAAANAASALGKGVHHSVTVTTNAVLSNSAVGATGRSSGIRRILGPNSEGQQNVSTGNDGSAELTGQDAHIAAQEAQLRSERKRSREKQRRNDVNKQFAELTEVLKNIEREAQEVGRNDDAYGSVSTMMAIAASTGPTNRVDLIARTIVHLERLNRTAKKQRLEIASVRDQLEHTKKAGEDMAEKLKDVMFNQQRQFNSAAYAPFPHLSSSGTQAAPNPSPMTATSGMPQQQHLQQQMPMMMMPMMMPQSTAQAPAPSGAPAGAPGPAGAQGVATMQQQQPQQQFMMVMHPGGQMTLAGQPMQQLMQPMAAVQQQPTAQQQVQQQVHQQVQQQQHQSYVQQQQPMQQQQQIAPAAQAPAGQGSSSGGGGGSNIGENFAHAA